MARSVHYVDAPLYVYRVRASSLSNMAPSEQLVACCKALYDLAFVSKDIARTESERTFVCAYMNQFYYQACAALCTLSEKQIAESIAVLSDFLLKRAHTMDFEPNHPFLNALFSEGAETTLRKQQADSLYIIERIAKDIAKKGGEAYLAPTGNVGLYLKTAFEAKGLSIVDFFDNDEKKEGMVVGGIPIRHPSAVAGMVATDRPITILIGTRYENAHRELKAQFLALGVAERDLIIIGF